MAKIKEISDRNIDSPFHKLYGQHQAMKKRSKARISNGEDCEMLDGLSEYQTFKQLALTLGWYIDCKLCFARIGDSGHYSKINIELITRNQNTKDAHDNGRGATGIYSTKFLLDDSTITINNLSQYCKDNNLNQSCMYKLTSGVLKSYKGHTLKS
jgi:hypothetical protein